MLEFNATSNMLTMTVLEGIYKGRMTLEKVTVMGISKIVRQVFLNEKKIDFEFDTEKMVSPLNVFAFITCKNIFHILFFNYRFF